MINSFFYIRTYACFLFFFQIIVSYTCIYTYIYFLGMNSIYLFFPLANTHRLEERAGINYFNMI